MRRRCYDRYDSLDEAKDHLRTRLIRRYSWPLVITALLVTTAVFSLPPLVSPTSRGVVVSATLRRPVTYYLIAPASNILDTLTLLSPAQYWASLAWCTVVFLVLFTRRRARSDAGITLPGTLRAMIAFLGGAVAIVGITLVAWRPMAALQLADPDLLAVDFHSHTSASHDGRSGFDAERNREWHASSGFDAVYITDHSTFAGALEGGLRNPATAGGGTTLLPGVELRDGKEHPILIGADPNRMRITSPDWKETVVTADGGPTPAILLLSMPGDVLRIPLSETTGPVRVAGIEISDGCPRGMAQAARDRDAIVALANKLHFALVSASNNHGWGRTAPAWSVMRIPGWRALTPVQLDVAIRRTIIERGPDAIDVVARRTAPPADGTLRFTLSGVSVMLMTLRTMDSGERISWLAWSWGLCFISLSRASEARRQRKRAARRHPTAVRSRVDAAA